MDSVSTNNTLEDLEREMSATSTRSTRSSIVSSTKVHVLDDPLKEEPEPESYPEEVQHNFREEAAQYNKPPDNGKQGYPVGFGNLVEQGNMGSGDDDESGSGAFCAFFLRGISILFIVLTFPVSIFLCVRVIQEYERAVIFQLGRVKKGGVMGPGLFFIVPCTDQIRVTDLRTVSFDVPPQEILTKDSVTVAVDAVVYYKIHSPLAAVCNVSDYASSTKLLASTTLRTILGTKNLSEILSDRETISQEILLHIDEATDPWGIKVDRVEVKDVRLPVQLQRAMAAEAEAAREARAKVIAAEGEQKSSRALKEASDILADSPSAVQLRYLQTLTHISAEKNSTIVFPLPVDMLTHFMRK